MIEVIKIIIPQKLGAVQYLHTIHRQEGIGCSGSMLLKVLSTLPSTKYCVFGNNYNNNIDKMVSKLHFKI